MGLLSRTKDEAATPVSVAVTDLAGHYPLDPSHTRIGFSARHAMVTKVRGNFEQFEGTAHVDTVTPANSSVTVTIDAASAPVTGAIDAASVTTGNEQRDGHLKTPDFFDTANYPQITFVSTRVERDGSEWAVTGDLTINGITKSVTVPFEETGSAKDPFGNTRVGFEG